LKCAFLIGTANMAMVEKTVQKKTHNETLAFHF